MAELPTVGNSEDAWGTLLNTFLQVTLNGDTGYHVEPFVDIRSQGASTSSSDNSTVINTAIATGKPVIVPPGTWKYTSPIDMLDDVIFMGLGPTSILQNDGTGVGIRYASGNSVNRSVLSNLKLVDGGSGTDLIYMDTAVTNNVLEKLWISSAGQHGIYMKDSFSNVLRELQVESCTAKGIYIDSGCHNTRLIDSNITGCDIGLYILNMSNGVKVSGVASESCTTGCMLIYGGGWNHVLRDCYIEYATGYGIQLDTSAGNGPNGLKIVDTYFYDGGSASTVHLDIQTAIDCKIIDCVFGDGNASNTHIQMGANAQSIQLIRNDHWGSGTNESFNGSATYSRIEMDTTNKWLETSNLYFDKDLPNKMEPYSAAAEPSLAQRQFGFWWDTVNSKLYWIYNMDGSQKKIELT